MKDIGAKAAAIITYTATIESRESDIQGLKNDIDSKNEEIRKLESNSRIITADLAAL